MKKIYALFLLGAMLSSTAGFAQTGSVTLTPPTGTPVSYASIGAAYAAIPTPLSGNYLIELQTPYDGTSETYPIQLTDKGLAAGGFRITIRPAAGNNGEIIQRPTPAAGVVMQFNGADNVTLDGRPGGIITGTPNYLSINDAFVGSNTNRNIELLNAANNNIIQYVTCTAADATVAGAGSRVILVGATTSTGNVNNTIQACNITGGLRGIQDFGQSDAIPNSGTKILANVVKNFAAIGIFAGTGQSNITINNNTVSLNSYNAPIAGAIVGIQQQSLIAGTTSISGNVVSPLTSTSSATTSITGIVDIAVGTENIQNNVISGLTAPAATSILGIGTYSNGATTFNVASNIISNLTGAGATSIIGANLGSSTTPAASTFNYQLNKISGLSSTTAAVNVRGMSIFPPAGSILNVYNSFIALTDANSTATAVFGILLGNTAGSNYTANVYYNSVRIGGITSTTALSGYGIFKSDANANSVMNIRNNICVADRGFSTGFYLSNTTGTLSIDYNNYYGAGAATSSYAASTSTTNYDNTQLAAYKTAVTPLDQNTTFSAVNFTSVNDLHLTGTSITDVNLKGIPVAGITMDIDGQIRSTTAPTKGGDENGAVPVQLLTFTGEKKGTYNLLQWATATEVNNNGFYLERSVDGTHFSSLGFIASKATNGNSVAQLNYTFSDEKPLSVKGFYRLKQMDKDGKTTYSAIVVLSENKVSQLTIAGIYPNPVANSFNLIVNTPAEGKVAIAIIGITGQALLQQQRSLTAGNNIVPMNVVSLPAGIYTVKVTNLVSNETITTRFIK